MSKPENKPKRPKKEPPRCMFCNKAFDKDEPRESVKREGQPVEFFHYECFEKWRDTMRRGGVMLYEGRRAA